jgi:esterase
MKLHYKNYSETGAGDPLLIMHGLFGSLGNWGWHSRALSKHFAVTGLDLRNHGASPHCDEMDYPSMAQDVLEFMDEHDIRRSHLLGHSMGGKVAMQVALLAPDRVDHLIIADIAPVTYASEHEDIFKGLLALDLDAINSRTEADGLLAQYEPDELVRQFLLTNLARNPGGGFFWRINLPALQAHYALLRAAPAGDQVFDGPVLFIKGALSNYILDAHREEILQRFPRANFKMIMHAGHWLHAEKPQTFYRIVLDFLKPGTQ